MVTLHFCLALLRDRGIYMAEGEKRLPVEIKHPLGALETRRTSVCTDCVHLESRSCPGMLLRVVIAASSLRGMPFGRSSHSFDGEHHILYPCCIKQALT